MDDFDNAAVILFCRSPGSESACRRYGLGSGGGFRLSRALLCHTLETLGALPADTPVVLLSDGPVAPDDRLRLGRRHVLELRQQGRTFEERLVGGLRRVAGLGFERLVVVGSDTPDLRAPELRRALEAPPGEAVVGGARDGGAYLIGLPASHLDRLVGLPWCTGHLQAALRTRLAEAGLRVLDLACRRDIDSAADVRSLRFSLERLCRRLLGCGLGTWRGVLRRPAAATLRRPHSGSARAIRAPPAALCS